MAYFIRNGTSYSVTDEMNMELFKELPVGNYVIKANPMTGTLFLEQIDSFVLPKKLYGNTIRHARRIIDTFMSRDVSTGVMLNGEKGSGKTLLAKDLSVELANLNIPCIVINSPWCGDKFNQFIQSIEQPCMVLFDEFEKVYEPAQQEAILTLLDGVFPSKKLFVLTCNDKWRVDSHMRNRPGRIFYLLDFKGLDQDFVREYCRDNLNNQDYVEKVCQVSTLFSEFNFDMLKALVEEMNRYNETPQEAIQMLNAKPEFSSNKQSFDVEFKNGVTQVDVYHKVWVGNPLTQAVGVSWPERTIVDGEEDEDWKEENFGLADIKKIDNDVFVFNRDNMTLTLTRTKQKDYDYWRAF